MTMTDTLTCYILDCNNCEEYYFHLFCLLVQIVNIIFYRNFRKISWHKRLNYYCVYTTIRKNTMIISQSMITVAIVRAIKQRRDLSFLSSFGCELPQIRRNWTTRETCNKLYIIADAKTTVIIINMTVTHATKVDRGSETGTFGSATEETNTYLRHSHNSDH
jgi:hypothetical protein